MVCRSFGSYYYSQAVPGINPQLSARPPGFEPGHEANPVSPPPAGLTPFSEWQLQPITARAALRVQPKLSKKPVPPQVTVSRPGMGDRHSKVTLGGMVSPHQ